MRHPWRSVLAVLALAGCSAREPDGALRVVVDVRPEAKATCVSVVAQPVGGGREQSSAMVVAKPRLTFALGTGTGLTGEIRVVARGFVGDCAANPLRNNQSEAVTVRLYPGVAGDMVTLVLSSALDDADGDGYRAASAGGVDCDDGDAAVHPGSAEACSNGKDDDCNGQADCADSPACDGAPCDDGQSCSKGDVCAAGVCRGQSSQCQSPPGPCFDANGLCSDDGGCLYQGALGSPCDDGRACTSGDSCLADGTCLGTVACAAPPGGACTVQDAGSCDPGTGQCVYAVAEGALCDDGDLCTTGDACAADGGCGGVLRTCSAVPDGGCFDPSGACDPQSGLCVFPVLNGANCDDGDACTTADTCAADGGCGGTPRTCLAAPDGGCYGLSGSCDPQSGLCVFPVLAGAPCDDGNLCTAGDSCSVAGSCAGTAYTCATVPECTVSGQCLGDGGCNFVQAAVGAPCDGGLCLVDGGCGAATGPWPYTPSNFSLAAIPDAGAWPVLNIDCNYAVFDSDSAQFTGNCPGQPAVSPQTVAQFGGPNAVLMALGSLRVGDAGVLQLVGSRPVVFAVFGDVAVSGAILANSSLLGGTLGAGGTAPGQSPTFCGARAGGIGPWTTTRGAGGGGGATASNGTPGGSGGTSPTGTGTAGLADSNAGLTPLVGGCPGGEGGGSQAGLKVGPGGSGGGAFQVSASGSVTIAGALSASGAGGGHGNNDYTGAGGGGSGGAILLEGTSVVVQSSATITANGGGGGEGAGVGIIAFDGEDGALASATPAAGGDGTTATGGHGGSGATGDAGAGLAENGTEGGGGGGAGVGRLRVNGYPACTLQAGALLSVATTRNSCN